MSHEENYKLAIEGRKTHLEEYHFWMNMYAIINGALFVGLYNVADDYISFGIRILGCLAGWFWHLSVRGFHTWMISWIKNVHRFEENYGVYKTFCNVTNKENKAIKPLSTPSITKMFTLGVAMVWSVLAVLQFYKMNKSFIESFCDFLKNNPNCIKFWGSLIILLLLLVFILVSAIFLCKESDLRKTNSVIDIHQ